MALTLPDDLPRNAQPRCAHFGECGGCALQDVPYEEQVAAKADVVSKLAGRAVEVVPSPDPWGYRHRMDYAVAWGKIGLRKRGDFKTLVNLNECHIVQPRVSELLPTVRGWAEELQVQGYNYLSNRGDLRYMVTRHALSSDQLMLILVTASRESNVGKLLDRLEDRAESLVWAVQGREGDDSHGEVVELRGLPTISQQILGQSYHIGPNTFFQNNLLLADALFEEAIGHVRGYLMDLYCGTGPIGLAALGAGKASSLLGVESVEENVELALRNVQDNGLEGAEFVLDNANHFLAFYEGPTPDTVIVDPPRSGLAPKLIRKLNRLGAPRIVYVSCNPKSWAADLEQFEGYELKQLRAFDMFPQTPHVELVSLLEKS